MPWDGSGNFTRSYKWQDDATADIKIRADRHDSNDDDIASGLANAIAKDGQSRPTADISLNEHKIVDLTDPTDAQDAATKKYVDNFKTFSTGITISGADENGRISFSSATGIQGLSFTAADFAWLARLAAVGPPALLNRLVLNTKADGTGTDVIELRDDGSALFTGKATVRGTSAQFQIVPTTGNGHVYWMAADGVTTRMIMYTSGGAQGNGVVSLGNGVTFQFGADGNLYGHGGAYLQGTTGNIVGSVWNSWGAGDAYSAINLRIEARAQAWAASYLNSAVTSMRMAGETAFNRSGVTGKWQTSGYVFTGVQGTSGGGDATYFARQPQHFIPAVGWQASFLF